MNYDLHRERAIDAWPILARAAKTGQRLSYGELSTAIGVHHRAASWYLGVIQRYCAEEGLPRLQALAVNKVSRVPGCGYAGSRGKIAHAKEVERVKSFPWKTHAPKRALRKS